MRLLRISLALLLLATGNALYRHGLAMHAAYRAAYCSGRRPASMSPAELLLLGSIVGVGIAGVWVGIVWRVAQ
ncbi:hypothetical protein C7441_12542 [Pseudaminobacter salicylatoxidans]|uniref:Uncharacterized protein n=1 Tax=Pseudaminobacter salicylatoxidans TaxID=93369 RepID=A0A316BL53_PSESE|nr:hypothetical protein [Pseudaminobacter salicylatoxidans]PWJ73858.1 hypothetical protein C7441_12542 [Pseudaminobacter salicylatoxidans]